jgi:DNA adenine methylase
MYNYIGGKHKTGKWIYENFPAIRWKNYTEIFGGAMWVYLRNDISADNVYFNDINPFLVNLWFCMKEDHRESFLEALNRIPYDQLDDRDRFLRYQEIHNRKINDSIDSPNIPFAVMMIYILTHCWSGNIIRQGCANPGSKAISKWDTFIRRLENKEFQKKIDKVIPLNLDFIDLINRVDDENGCFYVDPPYWNLEDEYYTQVFPKERHFELAEKLKKCESFWVLSYYAYDDLEDMYPSKDHYWRKKLVTKTAPHNGKSKEYEVIIIPKEKYDSIIKNRLIGKFFDV